MSEPFFKAPLNTKQAVLATLAFFDLFDYPLTADETHRYLFKLEARPEHVHIALRESKRIEPAGSYYQLFKPEIQNLSISREKNEQISQKLWQKIDRFRWVFALTPYLRLAAVCNTLAFNNADEESDIDLLIVAQKNRLFLCRIILTFWMQILGIRRHGKKIKARFCLSFFITKEALDLSALQKGPLDLYFAYWLQLLKPIYGKKELAEQLTSANRSWLKNFFFKPLPPSHEQLKPVSGFFEFLKSIQEKILNTQLGENLETRLQKWQIRRAKQKRNALGISFDDTAIVIHENILKFHNIDRRTNIYEKWIKTLENYL
ncbi:MAG: hypothetical protein WCW30_01705 [Candidatus Gracilibacteria bacterium]